VTPRFTRGDAARAALFVLAILAVTAAGLLLVGDALDRLVRLCFAA
jgi:hypothetical protein